MKSIQIFEQILIQSDEQLLRGLPTEKRLACIQCHSVTLSKRAGGQYYCPHCDAINETTMVTWYYKNQTADPGIAIERHRKFWKGIYFEQLARESFIKPNYHFATLIPDFRDSKKSEGYIERILGTMKRKLLMVFGSSHV